jgi:tetratricopeptide (TPR) repeat protein
MSEPLRTSSTNAGPASEADGVNREARIEQLLLAGLDQYFAGQYEQAIDIWTRVAFLERRHGRARAYIDRARSALAERQRESEELVHRGVADYHAGRLQSARELLTRAVEQGGPSDTALVFLQHLGRVEPLPPSSRRESSSPESSDHASQPHQPVTRSSWLATVVASLAVAAAILVAARPIASFLAELPVEGPTVVAPTAEPLPIVRSSDVLLARARALHAAGRLREALGVLDAIDVTDPVRGEADRLRAEVQRVLLADVPPSIDLPTPGATQ